MNSFSWPGGRATGMVARKRHRRPSRRGELAPHNKAHWFARYGKWRGYLQEVGKGREQGAEALCSDSSCSYLGRSVSHAVQFGTAPLSVMARVMGQKTDNCSCIVCIYTIHGEISRGYSNWRSQELTEDEGLNINQGRLHGWRR